MDQNNSRQFNGILINHPKMRHQRSLQLKADSGGSVVAAAVYDENHSTILLKINAFLRSVRVAAAAAATASQHLAAAMIKL